MTPAMKLSQDEQLSTFIHTCYSAIVQDKCGERRIPEQRGLERFQHYVSGSIPSCDNRYRNDHTERNDELDDSVVM